MSIEVGKMTGKGDSFKVSPCIRTKDAIERKRIGRSK
jgi:hypothetical protein